MKEEKEQTTKEEVKNEEAVKTKETIVEEKTSQIQIEDKKKS